MIVKYDIFVTMENGRVKLTGQDFGLRETTKGCMEGEALGMKAQLLHGINKHA